MLLRYLSCKNKYYLNGFDWVMGVIDRIMRHTTCAGNASQVVFMLDSPPDEEKFRAALQRFLAHFPVISGTISRHYTLTPYWKMPRKALPAPAPLTVTRLEGDETDLMVPLTRFINTPFRNEREHLAFHLVYGKDAQCLALTFDHRLLDARGAEAFMGLFQEFLTSGEDPAVAARVNLLQGFDLSQWKAKFLAGQAVNRRIIALSQQVMRALPIQVGGRPGFRYRILSFDAEETARITKTAYSEAGYLMIMPYLFARVFQALHPVFEERRAEGTAYVVPVSTDVRQAKDIREQLFFNHHSMFFFQVDAEEVADLKRLIARLKAEMYAQVQSRFPQNLMAASALTRIMPLALMRRIFHLPLQGKIASFCFSHVSKCSYASHDLMGTRIINVFHTPRMPVPPGVGIFFNVFGGRLNATISWLDGTLTDEEVEGVAARLRSSL